MTVKHDKSVEDAVAEYAKLAELWFSKKIIDEAAFEARLRAGLAFGGPDPQTENKIRLTKYPLDLFSGELFQAMISGGESFKPMLVSIMWDRMLAAGLATKIFTHAKGIPLADYKINQRALLGHLKDGTFTNLFMLPARLPDVYAHAVAAVDVIKEQNQARGTGFVVAYNGKHYFVTCRHNVDPDEGVEVQSITSTMGTALSVGPMELSPRYDIAVARMECDVDGRCFALSDEVEVFDEVFTLGYPLVPRAEAVLVGHRGEVNGRAQLYMERCPVLLISNLVSPGNSGGPVLTRTGHCIGMTINWLEGERTSSTSENDMKVERMRFSAAIPANLLRESIEEISKS